MNEQLKPGSIVAKPGDYIVIDNKRVPIEAFISHTTEESRQYLMFRRRNEFKGDRQIIADYVGPRQPNESRQVYRARIRTVVKKHIR